MPTELQNKIDGLNQEMKATQGRAVALVAKAQREHRELTASEQSDCDRLHRRFEAIETEIADETEAWASTPLPRVVPPQPIAGQRQYSNAAPTGRTYSGMFRNAAADPYNNRFETFGDFARAIMGGGNDSRLISNVSITEGSGVSAGFLVPPQFMANIIDGALALEAVRPNANVLPMSSATLDVPTFDYQDGTSGARAGLVLKWGQEGAALAEQVAVARKIGLSAKKANIFCRVSSELAEDAVAFDKQLSTAMSAAVASGLDGAFINGTGAGQPLGIMNSPALKTIAKITAPAQAASTVLLGNLAQMLGALTPGSYTKATWLAHPSTIPLLLNMQQVYVNQAANDIVSGNASTAVQFDANGNMKIFGRPVVFTDACAALSSAGDILLCDLSQYLIGMRRDAVMEVDRSVYFASDEIGFRLTMRLDGQPAASAATKLRDGTLTVSPFVAMGAR